MELVCTHCERPLEIDKVRQLGSSVTVMLHSCDCAESAYRNYLLEEEEDE